jgi:pantetheine-phosphate adenylyltransferase
MIAIYPGSFDPATLGHLDIIKRAASVADTLIVAVMGNVFKEGLFTLDERVALLEEMTRGLDGVKVISCRGLLAELFVSLGADVIVRGVRTVCDYEREFTYAAAYRALDSKIETLFIPANPAYLHISSAMLKEAARLGLDVSGMASGAVNEAVVRKFKENCGGI